MAFRTRGLLLALVCLVPSTALAQESKLHADFRREGKELKQACQWKGLKSAAGCANAVISQQPIHFALGSLAPGNGFAMGISFAERWTPNEAWRITWSADAVRATTGSWRDGFYMKLIHTPATSGVVVAAPGATAATPLGARDIAVIDVYAQDTSLRRVGFFGLGQDTAEANKTFFGERQRSFGASLLYPLTRLAGLRTLRASAIFGVTGRTIDLRPAPDEESPSIETRFNSVSAPGIADSRSFAELREGIRFRPSVANDRLRFNYLVVAQQYRTGGDVASFNRWTLDLRHDIPLYHRVSSEGPKDFNGPNECSSSAGSMSCPSINWSRNLQGTINVRALLISSSTDGTNRVPLYFQPTLGGADINGEQLLSSFADYRFRGPHLIAFQESLEHSIWGPIGGFVMFEQGKVALRRGDLDLKSLASSTTLGLTIRAGGIPLIRLSYSHGREGGHGALLMSASLLGGGSRPSLY